MFHSLLTPFYDSAEPVVKWLTVGIVAAAIVAGVIIFFAKRNIFSSYAKYGLIGLTFYALVIGLMMVIANLVKRTDAAYMEENYLDADVITYVLIPIIVALSVLLVCAIVLFVMSLKQVGGKIDKYAKIICGVLSACAVVAACVTVGIYYGNHIKDDGYYDGGDNGSSVNQLALYIASAALIIAIVAGALILGRKDKRPFDSRCIALAGICVALSFALSYIKLWELPQGGSVTFASLLPIMLFAYIYGAKKGVLIGCVYGILQAIQDPFIIHPAQFLLDYPIAFTMVGFAGTFANVKALDKVPQVKFILGAILAEVLRYIAHVISGVYAFSAYAGDGNFWLYSLAYNSFVFADLVLVVVVGALLFSSKTFIKQTERYAHAKAATPAEEQTGEPTEKQTEEATENAAE